MAEQDNVTTSVCKHVA